MGCMKAEQSVDLSPPVIRRGYDFLFEFNGLALRACGSSVTGQEYIYVNDDLVSGARNQSQLSTHEFMVEGDRYRVEFQVISKIEGVLVCRLYCNDKLARLFAAKPQQPPLVGPLGGIILFLALLINDTTTIQVSWIFVLALLAALIVISQVYAMRHIKIMELEV